MVFYCHLKRTCRGRGYRRRHRRRWLGRHALRLVGSAKVQHGSAGDDAGQWLLMRGRGRCS
jgi:hypothetical protein